MPAMTVPCSIGDKIGYIQKRHPNGKWTLIEDTVKEIRINKKGVRICQTEHFIAMDADEVLSNTNIMRELDESVLVQEVFFLDDKLRKKAESWINWANQYPETAKNCFEILERSGEQ